MSWSGLGVRAGRGHFGMGEVVGEGEGVPSIHIHPFGGCGWITWLSGDDSTGYGRHPHGTGDFHVDGHGPVWSDRIQGSFIVKLPECDRLQTSVDFSIPLLYIDGSVHTKPNREVKQCLAS